MTRIADQTGLCHFETNRVMKLQRPDSSGDGCFAEDRLAAASLIGIIKKNPSKHEQDSDRRCAMYAFRSLLVGTFGRHGDVDWFTR